MKEKSEQAVKVLAWSCHRNGICGDPFEVALWEDKDDGKVKLSIDFGGMSFAVLQVDKLAAGDIAFGSNSWRGDRFIDAVRAARKDVVETDVAPGAFCVAWPLKGEGEK